MALFHHFDSLVIVPYQCRGIYESVVVLTGPNALHPDQREIQPPRGKFAEWLLYLQVGKYKSPTLLNLLLGMANTFKWHCRLLFRSSCCCLLATAYFFCYGISPSSLPICTACVLRLALSCQTGGWSASSRCFHSRRVFRQSPDCSCPSRLTRVSQARKPWAAIREHLPC